MPTAERLASTPTSAVDVPSPKEWSEEDWQAGKLEAAALVKSGLSIATAAKRVSEKYQQAGFADFIMSKYVVQRVLRAQADFPTLQPGAPQVNTRAKPGRGSVLTPDIEATFAYWIRLRGQNNIPVQTAEFISTVNGLLDKTTEQLGIAHGRVNGNWATAFYKRHQLKVVVPRPLEAVRDRWDKPKNSKLMYEVYHNVLLKAKVAIPNPAFDPTKEYDEPVFILDKRRIARF